MRLGKNNNNNNNNNIKAASSNEGPSHPGSTPTGGLETQQTVGSMLLNSKYRRNMSKSFICAKLPAASWWRYAYNRTLTCRCFQARTLTKQVKFGAD